MITTLGICWGQNKKNFDKKNWPTENIIIVCVTRISKQLNMYLQLWD